jgi:UDP-glucose 4-epimerase
MSIVVTGSAGHLGEALVRSFRAGNQSAVGVDVKHSRFTDRVGSVCEKQFVEVCLKHATAIVHAATLHKPHLVTHSWQDFIDTNVTGTLTLLDAAIAADVQSFIYVSTTSAFGSALTRTESAAAVWVTEELAPEPKNIYGITKLMAENLCELAHRKHGLPIVVLRTSRFFSEEDDDPNVRRQYVAENAQANEMLYRRIDIEDAVAAVKLAVEGAADIGFSRYIISATTPFKPTDLPMLSCDAPRVVHKVFPESETLYAARDWKLAPKIDRVYVNALARADLGWQPRYDFAYVLECLRAGRDFRSALAREVGSKGYHDRSFAEGPYPVEERG